MALRFRSKLSNLGELHRFTEKQKTNFNYTSPVTTLTAFNSVLSTDGPSGHIINSLLPHHLQSALKREERAENNGTMESAGNKDAKRI